MKPIEADIQADKLLKFAMKPAMDKDAAKAMLDARQHILNTAYELQDKHETNIFLSGLIGISVTITLLIIFILPY